MTSIRLPLLRMSRGEIHPFNNWLPTPGLFQTEDYYQLDKKKLGEGSYGSVCKATNISTKACHLHLRVGWFFHVFFFCGVSEHGKIGGHSGGEDHLEVSDEEFGALQAGNCAFLRPEGFVEVILGPKRRTSEQHGCFQK